MCESRKTHAKKGETGSQSMTAWAGAEPAQGRPEGDQSDFGTEITFDDGNLLMTGANQLCIGRSARHLLFSLVFSAQLRARRAQRSSPELLNGTRLNL